MFAVSIKGSMSVKADSRVRLNRFVVALRCSISRQYVDLSSPSHVYPVSWSTSSHIVVFDITFWRVFLPQSSSNMPKFLFKGVPAIQLSDIQWK